MHLLRTISSLSFRNPYGTHFLRRGKAVLHASLCIAMLAGVSAAHAIVLFAADDTANRVAPENGAPWQYAARLDPKVTAPASGVYLGNRYVLTAEHVTTPVSVRINGVDYSLDQSFNPRQIDGVDLKLYRIAGNPGLPKLPLLQPGEVDLGKNCVVIGCGLGKGEPVPKRGWKWGDDTTRVLRWGINKTQGAYASLSGTRVLRTAFNIKTGPNEMSVASGDSGSPLFVKQAGKWKLAGIAVNAKTMGSSLYDSNPAKPGMQPDTSDYIPIKLHATALAQAMGTP